MSAENTSKIQQYTTGGYYDEQGLFHPYNEYYTITYTLYPLNACPNCGAQIENSNHKYCPYCGAQLYPEICPHCGKQI